MAAYIHHENYSRDQGDFVIFPRKAPSLEEVLKQTESKQKPEPPPERDWTGWTKVECRYGPIKIRVDPKALRNGFDKYALVATADYVGNEWWVPYSEVELTGPL